MNQPTTQRAGGFFYRCRKKRRSTQQGGKGTSFAEILRIATLQPDEFSQPQEEDTLQLFPIAPRAKT